MSGTFYLRKKKITVYDLYYICASEHQPYFYTFLNLEEIENTFCH